MKKGFTLVEFLAVITLLGVIGLIVFPILGTTIENNRNKVYEAQLEEIRLAAEKWAYLNTSLLPTVENQQITITLQELKKAGLVGLDVRDPRTNELLANDMQITITFQSNDYVYFVDGDSGSKFTSEYNENAPVMILNGNALEYVELGSTYVDKGAVAKDNLGFSVSVTTMYQSNGEEVASVDTSLYGTYTVVYMAINNNYTSTITRTVIVRDTTPPEIIVPENISMSISEVGTFNILEGVVVTDNSGESITPTYEGFDKTVGQNIVSYAACDSNNNCTTKRRIVNITE